MTSFSSVEQGERTVAWWSAAILYGCALIRPLLTLGFLWSMPHRPSQDLIWLGTLAASVLLDVAGGREPRNPGASPAFPVFDGFLYVVFSVQALIFCLFVARTFQFGIWTRDSAVAIVLTGVNSGYASLILAHELIHRRARHFQTMGRLMLATCFYEHWFTEHLRAHHVNVGFHSDAGSARHGETYWEFFGRSVPGQVVSAWRIEAERVAPRSRLDPRWLKSRVLQGALFEASLLLLLMSLCGVGVAIGVVLQAFLGVMLLEAVDYFTHWGLSRTGGKIEAEISWDSESRLTLYALLGLARHADHHLHVGRPYHELRTHESSRKLPYGYPVMVLLATLWNSRFRRLMDAALLRAPNDAAAADSVAAKAGIYGAETELALEGAKPHPGSAGS